MTGTRNVSLRAALFSIPAVLGVAAFGTDAEKPDRPAALVYVHPTPLSATDSLSDGLGGGDVGTPIETEPGTVLVWIDRGPGARFDHPSEYVLISPKGTRVVAGRRRPILNGEPAFAGMEPATVTVPVAVPKR